MTDELRGHISKGVDAAEILELPIIQQAFETIEKEIFELWKSSTKEEERAEIWLRNRGMQLFQSHLQSLVNNGKVAANRLQQLNSPESL